MSAKELSRKRPVPFSLYDIDLFSASPQQLMEMSRTMGLNLSWKSWRRQAYFKKRGACLPTSSWNPAQAWSEHCCYKSSKRFLRNIFGLKHPDICRGDARVGL